jgi:hypothetical protein
MKLHVIENYPHWCYNTVNKLFISQYFNAQQSRGNFPENGINVKRHFFIQNIYSNMLPTFISSKMISKQLGILVFFLNVKILKKMNQISIIN